MTHAQYMFKREGSRGGKNNTCKGMEARGLVFLTVYMEGLARREQDRREQARREQDRRLERLSVEGLIRRVMRRHYLCPSHCPILLFSCLVMSNSLQPHGLKHTRLPCPSQFPRICSDSCPLSQWCHLTISSSVIPFSSCLQCFPTSGGQSTGASASAPVFQWTVKVDCLSDGLVWSPCCTRDSQEYFLTPQFKSINSLAFSLLYGPTLTSIHDQWKSLSFQ